MQRFVENRTPCELTELIRLAFTQLNRQNQADLQKILSWYCSRTWDEWTWELTVTEHGYMVTVYSAGNVQIETENEEYVEVMMGVCREAHRLYTMKQNERLAYPRPTQKHD